MGVVNFSGKIIGCEVGMGNDTNSSALIKNSVFICNAQNVNGTLPLTMHNTYLTPIYNSYTLTYDELPLAGSYIESFKHNKLDENFKFWSVGGVTSIDTTNFPEGKTYSYKGICFSDEAEPCWWRKMILVGAEETLTLAYFMKSQGGMAYVSFQLIDPKIEENFPNSNVSYKMDGICEIEQTNTNDGEWHEYTSLWTNDYGYPVLLEARFIFAQESPSGPVDVYSYLEYTVEQPEQEPEPEPSITISIIQGSRGPGSTFWD